MCQINIGVGLRQSGRAIARSSLRKRGALPGFSIVRDRQFPGLFRAWLGHGGGTFNECVIGGFIILTVKIGEHRLTQNNLCF
jgi:hypothetical protein